MSSQLLNIFESIMIVTALSTDAFVASFAYGTNKIKIPFLSVTIINVICSAILAASLFFGTVLKNFIPEFFTHLICFLILFFLGLYKFFGSVIETMSKNNPIQKNVNFNLLGLKVDANISSQNDEESHITKSKTLAPLEAASLSIALSLDGLAVGIGAALVESNNLQIVLFSLISDMVAVMLGCFIGNKVAEKISFNLSWLSGLLLIILSFLKM